MFSAKISLLSAAVQKHPLIFSFLLGLPAPLAFSPFNWFWLMPFLLAGLFLIQHSLSAKRAAQSGFAFGFAVFGVGVSWVYVSISTFGGMPMLLAGFCVVVFISILSLYPALAAWLYCRCKHSNILLQLLCVVPAFWVVTEVLRNYLFGGFPWLEVGYSLSGTTIDSWATVIGIHGLSFIVVILAGCLAVLILSKGYAKVIPVAVFVGFYGGAIVLSNYEWTEPKGEPLNVSLVQSVIAIETKWDPNQRQNIRDKYFQLSAKYPDADLIIWPEAAISSSLDQLGSTFFDDLQQLRKPLLAGFVDRVPVDGTNKYYNAAALFAEEADIYRKQHLVPFGEYMPLRFILEPITRYLNIPNSSLSAWSDDQSPMYFKGHKLGLSICFEEAFPADMRDVATDADVLINLSEDAWFGRSLGPHQRLQMAQVRAIETGRPSLRSSNTALTSLIDHNGRIVKMTKDYEEDVLNVSVQPRSGQTLYMRFGDSLIFIVLFLVCAAQIFAGLQKWRSKKTL